LNHEIPWTAGNCSFQCTYNKQQQYQLNETTRLNFADSLSVLLLLI